MQNISNIRNSSSYIFSYTILKLSLTT